MSPCSIIMLEDLRFCMRSFAYVVNEKHILRFLGLSGGFVFSSFLVSLFVMKVVVVIVCENG